MGRGLIAVNRAVAVLLGALLLAAGAVVIVWSVGLLDDIWVDAPDRLDSSAIVDATERTWWPWALGLAGLVLLILGLRWLLAHLPRRGVSKLTVAGSGPEGRLTVDSSAVANAAAAELADTLGVRNSSGRVITDRVQLVVDITATIESTADIARIASAADQASADARRVLGREDLACRTRLKVARRRRDVPRVR